ncbi:MAG: ImmA/IrrE family metallo-endopeptidase [Bacteroidota bacterium]
MEAISVKNNLIVWARERSGKSIDALIKKFPKLLDWENGNSLPTLKQLNKLANATYTPFGYFFLNEPPDETLPIPNFRTVKDKPITQPSPNLIETVQTMQRRQDWMREYLVSEDESPLNFIGSITVKTDVKIAAEKIRSTLGLLPNWASVYEGWNEAVTALRNSIDKAGILIAGNGIVGNNPHRKLNVEEFRGFVLIDEYSPLIFINGNDSDGAQIFTMAHELAHIWLGKGAIFNLENLQPFNNVDEIFCNKVAAEFLIPEDEMKRLWKLYRLSSNPIKALSKRFKVGELATARRMLDLGYISKEKFLIFYNVYTDGGIKKRKKKKPGGNFYNNQNIRIGKRFARAVIGAVKEGRLLYRDGFSLTGLYGNTFDQYGKKLGFQ